MCIPSIFISDLRYPHHNLHYFKPSLNMIPSVPASPNTGIICFFSWTNIKWNDVHHPSFAHLPHQYYAPPSLQFYFKMEIVPSALNAIASLHRQYGRKFFARHLTTSLAHWPLPISNTPLTNARFSLTRLPPESLLHNGDILMPLSRPVTFNTQSFLRQRTKSQALIDFQPNTTSFSRYFGDL